MQSKLRILRVGNYPTTIFNKSGFHAFKLSECEKFNTIFLSPALDGEHLEVKDNVELIRINLKWVSRTSDYSKSIKFIIRAYGALLFNFKSIYATAFMKVDLVHIHSPIFIPLGLYWWLKRKKIYITFHGSDYHAIRRNWLYKYISFIFQHVFTLSPTQIQGLSEINKCGVTLVRNGVDLSIFNNLREKRKKTILMVGYFKPPKNHKIIIESFAKSKCSKVGYNLELVGVGDLEHELKELCVKLGVNDKVIFCGSLSEKQLVHKYNEAEIFILASIWEGNPKALLEAMACGCKILTTKVGAIKYIIGQDYEYFIPTNNSNQISEQIDDIINTKSYNYNKIIKTINGQTWDKIPNDYLEVYKEFNSVC
jgi:glycosyltransferase involved in cell wall biosynthesis